MMTSLYVIFGLAPQAPTQFKILATSMYQTMCNVHTRYRLLHLCIVTLTFTSGCLQHCKGAKYTLHCFQSNFFFGMEVWNGIWKKLLVWNGRKLPVWNMEKSSSIPFHTMPCLLKTQEKGQRKTCRDIKPAASFSKRKNVRIHCRIRVPFCSATYTTYQWSGGWGVCY